MKVDVHRVLELDEHLYEATLILKELALDNVIKMKVNTLLFAARKEIWNYVNQEETRS
jgi:hypothetical protein